MRWPARASRLVACVSSVDLPMPGSPPTSSTEPRTKPQPVTRSNSAIPERRRGASWLLPVNVSSANRRPLRLERIETGIVVAPVVSSSISVFHSPQDSHLPCQRLYAAPQFWQTKERVDLAMQIRSLCTPHRRRSIDRGRSDIGCWADSNHAGVGTVFSTAGRGLTFCSYFVL